MRGHTRKKRFYWSV